MKKKLIEGIYAIPAIVFWSTAVGAGIRAIIEIWKWILGPS